MDTSSKQVITQNHFHIFLSSADGHTGITYLCLSVCLSTIRCFFCISLFPLCVPWKTLLVWESPNAVHTYLSIYVIYQAWRQTYKRFPKLSVDSVNMAVLSQATLLVLHNWSNYYAHCESLLIIIDHSIPNL